MAVYKVTDKDSLVKAISTAKSGDVIDVQKNIDLGGSLLNIRYKNYDADNPLTITSTTGATIEGETSTRDSSNITFENLTFSLANTKLQTPTDATDKVMRVTNAEGITFDNVTFAGRMVTQAEINAMAADGVTSFGWARAGHGSGQGMIIDGGKDITIVNSEFHSLLNGIITQRAGDSPVTNLTVKDSYFHDMRSDGIQGGDQLNTVITGNVFENFAPYATDHGDFIQYWAANGKNGITNFQVSDNVFVQTDNSYMQTIFGNYSLRSYDSFEGNDFNDFSISGNTIFSSHSHGISLEGVDGFEIVDNILVPNAMGLDGDTGDFVKTVYVPRINITHVGPNATSAQSFDLANDIIINSSGQKVETRFARDGVIEGNVLTGGVYGGDIRFSSDDFTTTADDHITFSSSGLNIKVGDNDSIGFSGSSASAVAARAAYNELFDELLTISSNTKLTIADRYALYREAFGDYAAAVGSDWDDNSGSSSGGSSGGGTGGGTGGGVVIPPINQDDRTDDDIVDDFDWVEVSGQTVVGNADAAIKVTGSGWTSTGLGNGSYQVAVEDVEGYRHYGIQHRISGFDDDDVLDLSFVFADADVDASNVSDYIKVQYVNSRSDSFSYLSFDLDGDGKFVENSIKIDGDFRDLADLIDSGHLYLG